MAATTWNPDDKHADLVLSNGNLTATTTIWQFEAVRSVYGASSGKYYWEITIGFIQTGLEPVSMVGIGTSAVNLGLQLGGTALGWAFQDDALTYHNGVVISPTSSGFVTNDIVMVSLDMDNGKIWWGVNGTWIDSGNPSAGTGAQYSNLAGNTIYAMPCMRKTSVEGGNIIQTANFGATAFTYTVPTGFTQGFGTGLPGGTRKRSVPIWL